MSTARDPRTNPRPGDFLQHEVRREVISNAEGFVQYMAIEPDSDVSALLAVPLNQWCNWASRATVLTVGAYEGPPRDPRTDPMNGDLIVRRDIKTARGRRRCLGSSTVETGRRTRIEIQYEYPAARRTAVRSCSLGAWRKWSNAAEVM